MKGKQKQSTWKANGGEPHSNGRISAQTNQYQCVATKYDDLMLFWVILQKMSMSTSSSFSFNWDNLPFFVEENRGSAATAAFVLEQKSMSVWRSNEELKCNVSALLWWKSHFGDQNLVHHLDYDTRHSNSWNWIQMQRTRIGI